MTAASAVPGQAQPPPTVEQLIRAGGLAKALPARHVAGLILTYRCSISCRHCLFCCSTDSAAAVMTAEGAAEAILQLHELGRVVHIAGGEPMLYPETVLAAARRAARQGRPPHFVETNAFWATTDEVVRRRLGQLRDSGLAGVLLSADVFHQEFVPAEQFLRTRRIAREIFGEPNVIAPDADAETVRGYERNAGSKEHLAAAVRQSGVRLSGRAAAALSRLIPPRPVQALAGDPLWHGGPGQMPCRREFDPRTMWEVHVDCYGNIQTCCGVLLGHLRNGSVLEQARQGWAGNPLVAILRQQGPVGLLPLAARHGYRQRDEYPQKCYLCYELRSVLRPHYRQHLGPPEVYAARPALGP